MIPQTHSDRFMGQHGHTKENRRYSHVSTAGRAELAAEQRLREEQRRQDWIAECRHRELVALERREIEAIEHQRQPLGMLGTIAAVAIGSWLSKRFG
jgi:hypothetical protein